MFKAMKKNALFAGVVAAIGLVFSGGAAAQAATFSPSGPIWIDGYVSVDNTGKGGDFTDFNCKIRGSGFVRDSAPTILEIHHIQVMNHGAGEIPRGCHLVVTANYPWSLTMNPAPGGGGVPVHTSGGVVLAGVAFQAPGAGPGCGTDGSGGFPGGTITGAGTTAVWNQENPTFPGTLNAPQFDATQSRLVLTNATIVDSDPAGDCTISGVIKFKRPDALMAN